MNSPRPSLPRLRQLLLTPACVFLAASLASAQQSAANATADAKALAKYDKNKNGKLDADELKAKAADEARDAKAPTEKKTGEEDVITLSPFTVDAGGDKGYYASSTLSGTRLNSKVEDLASSITVITKQQLIDTAAVDINDIFKNEANTEGIYQYTEWTQDRGFTVDTVAQNPAGANRVRGATSANIANGNFTSSVPIDAYNVDAVEISRGPNSNIFGLGNAGGTVNVIQAKALASRDITSTTIRVDSYGGFRSTLDINRPIIKDKLAIRGTMLYEEKGYVRKPSYEKTNRYSGALTFRPFKKTTINASYESYHNYNNRPNSVTPRDTLTDWRAAGSPVWDPTRRALDVNGNPTGLAIGGWRFLNGSTYTTVTTGAQGGSATVPGFPTGIQNDSTGFYNRSSLWVDDGNFVFWTQNRGTTTLNSPGSANANLRFAQNAGFYQRSNYYDSNLVFHVLTPLYQQPGVNNKAIYDWTKINFAAPNFGKDKADTYKAELEQWFIDDSMSQRHLLALQVGFFREDLDRYSRNWVGNTDGAPPNINIDINEKLLNGDPNPYFLHPYISTSEVQAFRRPEINETTRATLAYQLDLTKEKTWLRWLGRNRFAGYGEYREMRTVSKNFRYRDQMVDGPYANVTNQSASGAFAHFASRYYIGDSIANGGSVVDYNARWQNYHGVYPLTWYQPDTLSGTTLTPGAKVTENIRIGEAFFSTQNPQKREVRTRGLIWQSFLWNERIIPTYGVRIDHTNSVLGDNIGGDSIRDPITGLSIPRFSFKENRAPINNDGRTTSKGIVVKVFPWLSLHYNTSDNFLPEESAYSINQQLLPNPTGKGKDYGFTLTYKDKLSFKYNRYDTFQKDSRNGSTGVLATRPLRLDFDTNTGSGDAQDLEDAAIGWTVQLKYGAGAIWSPTYGSGNTVNGALSDINGALVLAGTATGAPTLVSLSKTEAQAVIQEAYAKFMGPGIDTAYVDWVRTSGVTLSDINNISSKGDEIEINYNPTKFWTLKANITRQNAVDTAISATIGDYIAKRQAWWQSLTIPTTTLPGGGQLNGAGQNWFLFGSGLNNSIPRDFYITNIDGVYTFAVDNSGKRRPQTREWRVNTTTNYRLAGITENRWLKNVSVGGSVRWEDKAIIGYRGKPAGIDGIQRYRDTEQPLFDKARYYFDAKASYAFRAFSGRVRGTLQLNVNNVFENGRLQAVAVNPDGTAWNFRIIDPRQFILQATFDL